MKKKTNLDYQFVMAECKQFQDFLKDEIQVAKSELSVSKKRKFWHEVSDCEAKIGILNRSLNRFNVMIQDLHTMEEFNC